MAQLGGSSSRTLVSFRAGCQLQLQASEGLLGAPLLRWCTHLAVGGEASVPRNVSSPRGHWISSWHSSWFPLESKKELLFFLWPGLKYTHFGLICHWSSLYQNVILSVYVLEYEELEKESPKFHSQAGSVILPSSPAYFLTNLKHTCQMEAVKHVGFGVRLALKFVGLWGITQVTNLPKPQFPYL